MKARISKPFRILAVAAAVCLIAYLAVVVIIGTQWFHDALERQIVRQIEAATGARVDLESLQIQPLIFEIKLRGLTLHGSEGSSQPPLLSSNRLVIRINPESLWRGKLLISRFDGDGIQIHVVTRADGSTNIPGPHESAAAAVSTLMDVSIGTLNLQHSSLAWNEQKIRLDVTARNFGLLLYHGIRGGYYGSFSSAPLSLKRRGLALPPIDLVAHVNLSQSGITLSHLVCRSAGLTGQGMASLEWKSGLRAQASFDVAGAVSLLAKALRITPAPSGSFGVQGAASYENGAFSAQGSVQAKKVLLHQTSFSPGLVDFTSDFSASASQIDLTRVRVRALGGSFDGKGTAAFKATAPRFNFEGRVSGFSLTQSLETVPQSAVLQKLLALAPSKVSGQVEASWEGSFKKFRSKFDLAAAPPSSIPAGQRPLTGVMQGSILFDPGLVLRVENAQLATPHSNFSAQGQLGQGGKLSGAGGGLRVRYSTSDFQEEQPLVDAIGGLSKPVLLTLHSQAVFDGAVTGSMTNPEIEGQISVGAFTLQGWAWQSLKGAIRASPQGVAVENGQVRSGPSSFDFSGSASLANWKVTPHSQLRFTARATHSPLQGLEEAFGLHFPVSGLASGTLSVQGLPSNLSGQGDFRVSAGAIDREPFDELSGHVLITSSAWDFQNVTLRKKQGTLAGSARLDWPTQSFSLDFHGAHFSLADFERLRAFAPAKAGQTGMLQGAAEVTLQGGGSLKSPKIRSALDIQDLRIGGNSAGELKIQLSLAGGRLTGAASLQGPNGSLKLTSVTETRGEWTSQFSGSFAELRLDPWLSTAGRPLFGTPVVASGSVKGEGPLKSPGKLTLQAEASKLAILIPGLKAQNVQPVEVRYANGTLDSNQFEMRGPSTELGVRLSARLASPAELSLDVSGSAGAALLQLFDPALRAAGSFSINLHATGPVAQPSLSGELQVHDLSVRYGSLPLPVSGLNGVVTLKGNRATIQSLSEETGQTSIELSGYATLGQVPTVALEARFQRIRLEYPANFTSILSGEMKLTGTTGSSQLSGDVTVGEMFVSEDFNLVNWLGATGISFETPATGVSSGLASKVRLDVHVLTNPTVRLNSSTLSYVATIDATLRGTLARPVATGDIHLREGQAQIAGNTYQISRGDISMTSPYQTMPVLDIEAETRVERYDLTIEISGPADRAKMSYRSDPPLPNEEILSLLALGYAPQQTLMSSSGAQRMGAVGAGSLLSTALSSQVGGRFQKLFGVSRIRVDPNLLGPTSAGGARVTVEEQVSRDLTVTYSTNTAAAQQREIRLRWDVSNKISLIGERDINGVYGVEVRFRRRLR